MTKIDPDLPRLTGVRVLLAEDNATNQMVVTQMLRAMGAEVDLAVDGVEALERARLAPHDVMLIDIEMPRLTGIEVIRQLRADPGPVSGTPMIALTAYVMREHRLAIEAAGADGLISKPILSVAGFGRDIASLSARRWAARAAGPDPVMAPGGIDLGIFDALVEAVGRESMPELLGKVETDIANAGARVRAALASGELPELRAATHILISVGGAIGARTLQTLAQRMSRAAQGGDRALIAADSPQIVAEIDAALSFVRTQR